MKRFQASERNVRPGERALEATGQGGDQVSSYRTKTRAKPQMTRVKSFLILTGWHGTTAQPVLTVGITPHRFRIRAVQRTRLAGRNRWLEPGEEALVPKTAVRHGEWSAPETGDAEYRSYYNLPYAQRPVSENS